MSTAHQETIDVKVVSEDVTVAASGDLKADLKVEETKFSDVVIAENHNLPLPDEIEADKPRFGKRPFTTMMIHLSIWLALTAYMIALAIKGQGKNGYEFAIVLYVFVSLRLLAQHVSMTKNIYEPVGKVYAATIGKVTSKFPESMTLPVGAGVLAVLFLVTIFASPNNGYGGVGPRLQSFAGMIVMLLMLYVTSADRNAIKWRTVVVGLLIQYVIALFVLRTQLGVNIFLFISKLITNFLGNSTAGLEFLFGPTKENPFKFTFAIAVLPAIVFFCSFISIVYYLGGMQYIIGKFAWLMVRLMDTSGSESVVAAASPFVGQGESALLVKPFVEYMTMSELHSTMTSGFATIAGSVLLAYVNYTGNSPAATSALLTACVMSVPCSLLVSKMRLPEKEESLTRGKVTIPKTTGEQDANFLHAAGNGAAIGVQLILLICGALLSIVSLYSVADFITGWTFDMINVHNWLDGSWITIQFLLSYAFYPIAIFIGIIPQESRKAAEFMATKTVVNEFVAYNNLYNYAYSNVSNEDGSFPSNGNFSPRTLRLLAFALCGFANLASIGIQIGCLGTMAPSRRKDLAQLALSAMIAGTFSTWITAAVAGTLI